MNIETTSTTAEEPSSGDQGASVESSSVEALAAPATEPHSDEPAATAQDAPDEPMGEAGGELAAIEHDSPMAEISARYESAANSPSVTKPATNAKDGKKAAAPAAAPVPEPPEPQAPLEPVTELEYAAFFADPDADGVEPIRLKDVEEALNVMEGFLFTTVDPLSVGRLGRLTGLSEDCVRRLLHMLRNRVLERPGGLQVVQVAGGWQIATKSHLSEWMLRLHRHRRRAALSGPSLETLAIIAYRQPITKGEIEAIRGVDSSGALRALQDLGLLDVAGRKEVVGRPQLYVTTPIFLKTFGLRSIADLPPIAELRKRMQGESAPESAPKASPVPDAAPAVDPAAAEPQAAESEAPLAESASGALSSDAISPSETIAESAIPSDEIRASTSVSELDTDITTDVEFAVSTELYEAPVGDTTEDAPVPPGGASLESAPTLFSEDPSAPRKPKRVATKRRAKGPDDLKPGEE